MRNLFLKVVSFVAILLLIAAVGTTVSAYEYPDEGYWANEAIDAAIENGLLRGKDDGKMHSEDNLTRAEMAAIMVRSFGATIEADISNYSDLKPSAWYYKDFAKAVQMKVFEGDGSGKMRPDDFITREEVFTVVARALVLNDTNYAALDKFNDKSQISDWAKGYMSILTQKSYVNGDNLGNANPKKNITRAEFAQLMHNIFRNYYSKADTYADFTNSRSTMVNVGDVTFKNATVNGDLVIGDGNAKGTIRLENVKIKGRLLVRGSQRVELVNTTVDEMVVVNNYNTVVHFDNYRDEAVFDDIVLNTEATFKEKATEPVKPTPGGVGGGGGGGTTETTGYKVEYYIQNINLDGYTLHSKTSTEKVKAGTQVSAEVKDIEGFTHNPANTNNVLSGVVSKNKVLTLKVYYDRNSYDYTVKYYQQNVDNLAKYDEVIADGYIRKALFEANVTADTKTYTGFKINEAKSVKTGKIAANNNLLLQVYFDREVYTITFDGNGYTGTIPPVTAVYGQKISALLPELDRGGYLFDGWFVNGVEVDGNYVLEGPVELKAGWTELAPTEAKYKVEYYIQDSSNLANYIKYDDKQFKGTIGETVNADTTRVIEHYTFDNANVGNKISGEVLADGSLVLKVYYNIKKYDYSVTYYTEKLDGTYEESTQTLNDVYGKEVSVVPVVPTGFELNSSKSTLSGTVDGNGNPELKVYYDRRVMEYDIVYRTEKTDGTYDVTTETKSAKYGMEVVAAYRVPTGFELDSTSVLSGTVPATGKLVLKVYYVRKSYNYTVKIYEQNVNDLTVYNEVSSTSYSEKFGKTVSVTPDDKTGFDVNTTKSVLSGEVNENNSLVLAVYYDREVYTITFDGNGYTGTIPSVTAAYGQSISTKLPSIERDGYVFDGWFVNGTEVDGSYTVTGPVELKAEWTEIAPTEAVYKVVYYIEDSSGAYTKYDEKQFKGTIGETVTADTTKVFSGYAYNASHSENVLSGTVPATGTLVLKVYYDRADYGYKVIYYTEKTDGTYEERTENLTGKFGDYVSASTTVPTGFELGANSILDGYVNTEGTLELKVYYNRKEFEYKINYYTEAVGGGYTGRTEVYSAKYGTTVTVTPNPSYGFVTDTINSVLSGVVNENGSLVLEVYYDRASYTIKFVAGQGLSNPADKTVYYNVPVELPTLSKIDYEFKGWTDGTNVYSVGASAAFTSDATLTAIWEYVPGQITYTVEYYVQNTDLATYTMTSQPMNGTVGSTVTVTPEDKTGFDVNMANSILSGTVDRDNPLVLKVYYDRESYTISFNAGAGVVSPASITAYYGVEVTLPVVAKDDYIFDGWSDGTYVYNGTATFKADTALTAEWTYAPGQIAYTIEYYTQNTDLTTYTMTSESKSATSGTTVSVTPEEKTGFDVNTANSVLEGTATSGLVLKVYYDREAYTVSFNAGEGVANPADITAYYGVEVTLPTLTKEGFRFDGWSDGTNTIYGTVTFTEDTALTALWTELIDYVTVTFYDRGSKIVSVDVEKDTTVAQSQFPDRSASYTGYVKDSSISSVYAEPYEHIIKYGWWYNPESDTWEEFTSETVVTENTDVHLKINKFSAVVTMADGMSFDFYAYYEPETRFIDSIKDIVYKKAPLMALHQLDYLDKVREKGIVQKVLDTDDNIMMLSYMVRFSTILGEENVEKFIVDNAKEMFASGNNELLHDAFVEYIIAVANSDNPDEKKKVHDLMESTINHIFEEDEISTETLDIIRDLCHEVLNDPETFKEVTGYELATLPSDTKTFVIDFIILQLTGNDELFEQLVEEVIGVDYTDTTTTKDLIIAMAEKELTDNFDSTIDGIKESQKNLIVATVESMLSDSSNALYDEVLTYAVDNEKATIIATIKTLLETEDSLYNEVIAMVADDFNYRAMVAEAVGVELAVNDALFEVLTGYDPSIVPDRAAAIDTLKDEITNNKSSFETAITDAENAGYKSFIIDSVVSKLETNDVFFNTVLEEAKVDYRDTMVDTIVDKLEESNSPMYDKVIELAKTDAYKQTIKDAVIDEMNGVNGDDMIKAITGCTDAELAKNPQDKDGFIMGKVEEKLDDDAYLLSLVESVTGFENYTLPATPKEFIIDMVIAELSNTGSTSATRDMIIEEAITYLLEAKDEDEISHLADYAIDYLGKHPDERDALVDEIINDVYKDELDKLVYQLINDEQFEVHADTVFVAEGLKKVLLEDYNYETIFGSKVPEKLEKVFEIYPEEKLIELYDYAMNNLIAQIDTAIADAIAGETGYIDCGITPVVNIIADVYIPLYESYVKIVEGPVDDKIGDNFYYKENIYLQELMKLLDPEVWVQGSANPKPSDTTGYKIYDLDYYYDLMYKIYVLGDDAILWYYNNISEEKYIEVTEKYEELILKYVNIIADKIDIYVTSGEIPKINEKVDDKISAAEKAIVEKYPELVKSIIDKYKSTDFFNKDYTDVDYDKVRDKVYEIFVRALNFKTDEYFDKILNRKAIEDLENKVEDKIEDKLDGRLDGEYYTKIDDNTYEFEVNDYKVVFKRILTDA